MSERDRPAPVDFRATRPTFFRSGRTEVTADQNPPSALIRAATSVGMLLLSKSSKATAGAPR